MAQLDCYRNPNPESREWAPFLVDLQHGMLSDLRTRVMAPLVLSDPANGLSMSRLNPKIVVEGQECFLSTAEMAAVPLKELESPIGNLADHRAAVLAAVDVLFTAI